MAAIKLYRSYGEQVAVLESRGMDVGDPEEAARQLRQVNYYRLSGYWYPFRQIVNGSRVDNFYPGTTLTDVLALYNFDASLRTATFGALAPIELTVRALLGHALGRIGERAHLDPSLLGARARQPAYEVWRARYESEVAESHEDFVEHHRHKYGGEMPVWAAVEVLDWGGLTKLFGFSPRTVQDDVAAQFNLRAPQLESWLKSLNIVRNVCAHHGRLFNRVFALAPKLPTPGTFPDLDHAASFTRSFGHLTMIQFLLDSQGMRRTLLPSVMRAFPVVKIVPPSHTGAPDDWDASALWR